MTQMAAAGERPLYQRPLPRFLFDASGNSAAYVVKAWLLTLIPSLGLAYLASALGGLTEGSGPQFGPPGPYLVFMLVVFAPVVETLLMTPPLLLLIKLLGPTGGVVASALLWGVAHSLAAPAWGLIVWWPFLIFSAVIAFWWGRGRLGRGMLLVTIVHAMQNAVPTIALLLS